MKPEHVAKKSAWSCVSFLSIILCVLIIPIFVLICRIITVKKFSLEFYQDKVVIKSGWLNTKTQKMVFMGVTGVSVDQSFGGKIFGYGNVKVDCVGKWDVNYTTYIVNPQALEAYLNTRMVKVAQSNQFVHM